MAGGGVSKRGRTPEEANAERALPNDLRAEESLLGAALLTYDALEILATRTRPEDFYRPNHGHIAAALTRAFEEGYPADPVTISAELERMGVLEPIGGLATLLSLQVNTPSTTSAARYAEIVHDRATLRRLIGYAAETAELGYEAAADPHAALERARTMLDNVAANNGSRTYSSLHAPELGELLDGTLKAEEAAILLRSDGKALLYPGKMHVFQAEPTTGKTWIVLVAVLEVLAAGGAVVYLDYEDTARGIVGRLLAMRAETGSVRDRFYYVQPEGPFGLAEKVHLKSALDRLNPDLVVIDGVAEALARDGYDEDKNADVVKWIEKFPRWISRTGAAVVMIDHVAKDPEKRGRHARGAGHKLAAVDGVSYEIIVSQSFSRHRAGRVLMRIAKDRPGAVGAIGEIAASVTIEPHADGQLVDIRLEPPKTEPEGPWRPTHLMQRVSEELERSQAPITASGLKATMASKKNLVEAAIAGLLAGGFIVEIRHGRAVHLRSARPYREDGDPGPTEPAEERLTDEQLFDDQPPMTTDELAERRARREKGEPEK